MDPKLISDLHTLRAHAYETQRLADDMIKKLEGPPKAKRRRGASEEQIAQALAKRMKTLLKPR